MSRLIRDKKQEKLNEDCPSTSFPLSNSVVVSHLKACQRMASSHAKDSFKAFLGKLDETLAGQIEQAKSNNDATHWLEVQQQFRQQAAELERYFSGYLAEGFVKFKRGELCTTIGSIDTETGTLSLVDHDDLDETIAISTIVNRADDYFAETLWALNQRFAVLNSGEPVSEVSNPSAPVQYCESFRKSLKLMSIDNRSKQLAYRLFDDVLIKLVAGVSEEINTYLKGQGVLPNLRFSAPKGKVPESALKRDSDTNRQTLQQSGATADAESADGQISVPDSSLPPDEYQSSLVKAIRGLQQQANIAHAEGSVPSNRKTLSSGDLLGALQSLQLQAQAIHLPENSSHSTATAARELIDRLNSQLHVDANKGVVKKADMQTIDLVGMLFEYMLSDENLPDSIKALLSYLHTPFLKVAFIDPGFFEQVDHPARVLLNSMAEAGSRWVGNDGTSQYDIYNKIKEIVDRILKGFDNDIKFITELLLEFSAYTKNIIRRQELMEKRATEKAQGEEKLREVKLRVNEEIRSRTEERELPSAVLLFLLQPWSDYLSFALLRYGEKSDRWGKALAIVDDVLWCIEPKEGPVEKARQLEIHEDLLSVIESGFETIGYDHTKGAKLIDAISSLIKMAVHSQRAEPAPASMRDQLERIAAEKAGARDLGRAEMTPEEAQMVDNLKLVEFGTWFEFETGKRLKVAWYNARTSHYMLVDQMGKRVDMMSGLSLARAMISGRAKIISGSSKPFFERALENIYQKLNEEAETASAGDQNNV